MHKKTSIKSKADLILAMQELLQKHTIGTQEEICAHLEKKGFNVNQVMISRILHKLGAVKINEGNQTVYRLSTELANVTPYDSLKQLVVNITHNEHLIVIHTVPGSAQLVARLLDLNHRIETLGTLAGDDTIFVAPASIKHIKIIFDEIYSFLLK